MKLEPRYPIRGTALRRYAILRKTRHFVSSAERVCHHVVTRSLTPVTTMRHKHFITVITVTRAFNPPPSQKSNVERPDDVDDSDDPPTAKRLTPHRALVASQPGPMTHTPNPPHGICHFQPHHIFSLVLETQVRVPLGFWLRICVFPNNLRNQARVQDPLARVYRHSPTTQPQPWVRLTTTEPRESATKAPQSGGPMRATGSSPHFVRALNPYALPLWKSWPGGPDRWNSPPMWLPSYSRPRLRLTTHRTLRAPTHTQFCVKCVFTINQDTGD